MSEALLLKSNNIFDGINSQPFKGYIVIEGDRITDIKKGAPDLNLQRSTRVTDLGDKLISPGFVDVHCFFSGLSMSQIGVNFVGLNDLDRLITLLDQYHTSHPHGPILGHGTINTGAATDATQAIEERYPDVPVVLMSSNGDTCVMNQCAISTYKFDPDHCYPEAYFPLMSEVLQDKDFIVPTFQSYMKFMNSRGITAVKEVCYDDYSGFLNILKDLQVKGNLTLRYNFTSQPVAAPLSTDTGHAFQDSLSETDPLQLAFSGYNIMTDGSISEHKAELKRPYSDLDTINIEPVDWESLQRTVARTEKEGFRVALHAQGDAAIAKSIDILENCERDKDGKLQLRHCMTDLEFSDPQDLERMGKIGITAEVYPQIQSLATRASKLSMINEKIGEDRGKYYWNRRKMIDSGVVVSCGTDLPLLFDNIPDSIYHAAGGLFPEGGTPFNTSNTMTRSEVLKAWTYGGAFNLNQEKQFGTLEIGKLADISVIDQNIMDSPMEEIRNAKVCLTVQNGTIVYSDL